MPAALSSVLLSLLSLWVSSRPEAVESAARNFLRSEEARPEVAWVTLPRGIYRPLFPASPTETEIMVRSHQLQVTPVTNQDALAFVERHPEWRRDRVSSLFADAGYLSHWAGPSEIGDAGKERPVTNVSWFFAKAYCEDLGARLPTEAEWERAAAASPKAADGRSDPEWSRTIIDWYSAPSRGPERDVGKQAANFFGVKDMSGLVWEWVLDFNSTLVTSDSRNTQKNDKISFCGSGALGSRDPENYVSFMRVAFRNSLRARYVARHLGFRCARDLEKDAS